MAPISPDLKALDEVIRRRLASEVVLIDQIAAYIIQSGGKRVRPALLLLIAKALGHGKEIPHALELAAVVEFIHTATLLHDDVVDESTMRRGKQTANAAFGNAASVLVGDFLYSRAFQMMVSPNDIRVMQILSNATNTIAEGEVLQLLNMNDPEVDESSYLQVIRYKTAKLFEASCRLAGIVTGQNKDTIANLGRFGAELGSAFQLIDDVLDYDGDAGEMGKNLGDDLREGKVTLPIICALRTASDAQKQLIRQAIEEGDVAHLDDIRSIILDTGALKEARASADAEAQRAIDAAKQLPDNAYSAALLQLAADLLGRRS